jgi:hypothetical protein
MATDMLTTYQFSDDRRFGAHAIACVGISLFGQGEFAVPIGRELGATH